MKSTTKKIIFRWVKILTLLYALTGFALYYLQDTFLFHPESISRNLPWQFDQPFEETDIVMNETDTINLVKFFPAGTVRRGVVLYFHGNKENIGRYAKFAPSFTKHDFEVWMPDYPGFGKSTGNRSEKALYQQAVQLYKMAASKYGADSIIIYGKSFGTGIATYLAAVSRARQLILETPYYSIPELFSCYAPIYPNSRMAKYKIPTHEYLAEIQYPITIFHGTSDGVIPYRSTKKLQQTLKPGDAFITIPGGTHHNLYEFEMFRQKLASLLQ
ncbi:MAG TPA: alpha/beta fold hydrolase [Ferruginibacter sp.]|nr:alpha/beta fold hydrolase [Ferruginibacter sp.]HMP22427.1 alpha/beta fold hydrolase [Ferruginibacter sp.]